MTKQPKQQPNLRFPEFNDNWTAKKLGEVITNQSKKYNPEKSTESIKCIELEHLSSETSVLLGYIDGKNSMSIKNVFDAGEVLFGKLRPYLRKYLLAPFKGVCSSEIWVLKSKQPILLNNFIFFLIQTNNFIELANQSSGSKMPRADWKILEKISLSLPSLPEQSKIADFLSTVDKKLNLLSQEIALSQSYKKGLMQALFSQTLRFKDDQGQDFPDWEEKTGGNVFEAISNRNHNSDLPILAITQKQGILPRDLIDYQISVTEKSVESYKVVEKGDFVISLRSFQGGIEYSNFRGICSPAYVILRPKIKIIDAFYKHFFKTETYIKFLNLKLEGIRDGKMVSYKYFSEIKIPFPSLPEQVKIAGILSAWDEKIANLRAQEAALRDWKRGLLQEMFV